MSLTDKIAANSSAQVGGQLVGMVSGLLSVAIAARYLTLEEYGSVIAAMVLVSMFSVLGTLGLPVVGGRQIAREPKREEAVAAQLLWSGALFALLPIALTYAVAQVAYGGPEDELSRQAVLILLTTFALKPLRGVAQAFAIAGQRMYLTAVSGVGGRFASVGLVALFAALDAGPLAIAAAYAASILVDDLITIMLLRGHLRFTLRVDRVQMRGLVAAALPLGGVMVLNQLYFKLDAFLLAVLATDEDVALYGVAYRILEMLMPLAGYVMVTLLPELARLRPGDARFTRLVEHAYNGLWLLALPLLSLGVLAPEIMTVIGGGAYAQGATVLVLILVSLALATVNAVFGHTLVSQGHEGVLFKVSLVNLLVNVILNVLLIPRYGVIGAGLALVATEVFSLAATVAVYARIAPVPRTHRPVRMVLAGGAMAGGLCVKFVVDLGAFPTLMLAGAAGALCYLAALWALHAVSPELLDAVRGAIVPRLRRLAGAR